MHGVLISPLGDDVTRLERLRDARHARRCSSTGSPTTGASRRSRSTTSWAASSRCAHLIETGRRRIAFVGGPIEHPPGRRPSRGRATRGRRGARARPSRSIETESLTVLEGRAAGEAIRDRAAAERPDAVFAANDLLAMGVLQALNMMGARARARRHRAHRLRRHRLRVGRRGAALLDPPARRAHRLHGRRPAPQGGRRDERLEPEQVVFQPELVVRASTRA